MKIDDKQISYLEDLAHLSLSGGERTRFIDDLQNILDGVSQIIGLNTDGVKECTCPIDSVNVFRNDEKKPSLDRELILKNAPARNEEYFITPKTIE
ncbi:MAG: Asp-tRNA(Asn)/Glu-tRNA(Gln) amidotransferase subunit GatC [Treponema sp.]|nr:Asp-tRNA(Asn)/Glu-tRNA(Gln) amidotransferase subunit GatC [Treponema sp.]